MPHRVTVRIERGVLNDVDRAARARDLSRNDYMVFSAVHCAGRDAADAATALDLIGNLHRDVNQIKARLSSLENRDGRDR